MACVHTQRVFPDSCHPRYVIHITDSDPGSLSANGWLEDTSLVEKYVMSDADYDKREKSYRKWKVGGV